MQIRTPAETPFANTFGRPSRTHSERWEAHFSQAALLAAYSEKIAPRDGRGIDRVGVDAFDRQKAEQLAIAEAKCRNGTYKFAPYLEHLIARGAQRPPRVISGPTLRDRVVLHQLKEFLQEIFPDRVGRRLPNEFIRQTKAFAAGVDLGEIAFIRADISSFYDNIRHDLLIARLLARIDHDPAVNLVRRAIRSPTLPAHTPRAERRGRWNPIGVPQGLAVSNVLASIYLEQFDAKMEQLALFYLRYVDDILLFISKAEQAATEDALVGELASVGLTLNKKYRAGIAREHFEYLGYSLNLPQVSVKRSAVERFIRSIAAKVSAYQYRTRKGTHPPWLSANLRRQALMDEVNEKITGAVSGRRRYGWLFHYLEIEDLALLHKLDTVIGRLFSRLPDFAGANLAGLKRLSRAYFEAKYSPTGGYILNYNGIATASQKLDFLVRRGLIDPADAERMSIERIEEIFEREKRRRLTELELDVAFLY